MHVLLDRNLGKAKVPHGTSRTGHAGFRADVNGIEHTCIIMILKQLPKSQDESGAGRNCSQGVIGQAQLVRVWSPRVQNGQGIDTCWHRGSSAGFHSRLSPRIVSSHSHWSRHVPNWSPDHGCMRCSMFGRVLPTTPQAEDNRIKKIHRILPSRHSGSRISSRNFHKDRSLTKV